MHASVLKYFIEVAQCGSVRKASERLYVAASAEIGRASCRERVL